jgi:hypothetical protein
MRRFVLLAAICFAAGSCGRFGFDFSSGTPDDASDARADDAPRNPTDVGVPVELCPARAMTTGTMVSTATQLQTAVATAAPGDTILLADGVYNITATIPILTASLTIRSASNDAAKVIVDGGGTAAPVFYAQASMFTFVAITIRNSGDEAIRVEPTAT